MGRMTEKYNIERRVAPTPGFLVVGNTLSLILTTRPEFDFNFAQFAAGAHCEYSVFSKKEK